MSDKTQEQNWTGELGELLNEADMQVTLTGWKAEFEQAKKQIETLKAERDELKSQKKDCIEIVRAQLEMIRERNTEIAELRAEVGRLKAKNKKLKDENYALTSDWAEAIVVLEEACGLLTESQESIGGDWRTRRDAALIKANELLENTANLKQKRKRVGNEV